MSSRTTNLNLVKPSSDENVSLPVINGNYDTLDTEVAARVKTADIQNNLTSTATNKPLSAAQGKALSDTIAIVSENMRYFRGTDGMSRNTPNSDANVFKENGVWRGSTWTNVPPVSNAIGILLCLNFDANYGYQLYEDYMGDLYKRNRTSSSTWGEWKKLAVEQARTTFSLAISSAITDAESTVNTSYYNHATGEVHLVLQILSRSGKIPTANNAIATIPAQYRPSTSHLRMAMMSFSSAYDNVLMERLQINTNGTIALNNFIHGAASPNFIAIDTCYYL